MVSKATILKDIFKLFYDRINSQVTSVTIDSGSVFTIQSYTSSFPDKVIDDKSSYPIIVVNPADISWEDFTLTKKKANGTIQLEVYSTNSESSDMFLDAMINTIETYRNTLWSSENLKFVSLDSTDTDKITREGFKVHIRRCIFSFEWHFTKTAP